MANSARRPSVRLLRVTWESPYYHGVVRDFESFVKITCVSQITVDHMLRYRAHLAEKDNCPRSINKKVSVSSSMLNMNRFKYAK